jgi:aminopeptidase N
VEYWTAVSTPKPPSTDGSPSIGDPYLPTSGNGGYLVDHYDVSLDYRVETNRMTGTVVISARATQDLERFSLDFTGLLVDRVTIGGERPKKITTTARKLVLSPMESIEDGAEFEVIVKYHGTPHPLKDEWGEVGWEELSDGVLVASQPNGASSWLPCNDHPSNKARFSIAVNCEAGYTVVANGLLLSKTTNAGRTRWIFEAAEPMATYLATVQIGRYRSRKVEGTVPAATLHYPARLAAQVATDFGRLGDMIEVFTGLFGPYPFREYDVVVTADKLDIPLEAHGMAIFGSNHVDGEHGSDRLIAHELAHQWFGNSLTVSRWKDIWLHEGFACYAEWLWGEASGGPTAHESARRHWHLLNEQPQDIVVGDPGPRLLFDDRVYKRGAVGLHAIRRSLGDEAFFVGLRTLTAERRSGNYDPDDVLAVFAASPRGRGVARIVNRWIYEAPLPTLR